MMTRWTISKCHNHSHEEDVVVAAAVVVVEEVVEEEEDHSNAKAAVVVVVAASAKVLDDPVVVVEAEDAVVGQVVAIMAVATITMPGRTITMEAEEERDIKACRHHLAMTCPIWDTWEVLKCPFEKK